MKKKILIVFLICCLMFGIASPALAIGETWYNDAQVYIQIDEDSRLILEYAGKPYDRPVYIVDHGDSLEFVINGSYGTLSYVAHSDGSTLSSGLSGLKVEQNKYGFSIAKTLTVSYPFSIGGVEFTSKSDFMQKCQGSKGFYSLPANATSGAADAGDSFFLDPLLEKVKELQKGTTIIPVSLKDSYLDLLVPLAISCLALLISLPLLLKVLRRFLG